MRTESDSLGRVRIDDSRYWGAQTQRAVQNFAVGDGRYRWGRPVIKALGQVKKAAAQANAELGVLPEELARFIVRAADEVIDGQLDDHFPVGVWQSGSGTQSNMNANEVISHRSVALAAAEGVALQIHPNDHVNLSQSSNDVFPTVMHLAIRASIVTKLMPALDSLRITLASKRDEFADVVKVGRTHLQDAAPLTVGQEFSGWEAQIANAALNLQTASNRFAPLAIGGTAVGTGLNAPSGFASAVVSLLGEETGTKWVLSSNYFAASSAHDEVVAASATLRTLAGALLKIGNDMRWLAAGPRAGIAELSLPANEPGSSIMPGKVNPTQIEMLTMVAVHVFGNDAAVAMAGSQGSLQLNTYKPLMLHLTLESIELLADAVTSFNERCLAGINLNRERIAMLLAKNLMLVTALAPHIGYDNAAQIAHEADVGELPLRQVALASGHVTAAQFDEWVNPLAMTGNEGPPPTSTGAVGPND